MHRYRKLWLLGILVLVAGYPSAKVESMINKEARILQLEDERVGAPSAWEALVTDENQQVRARTALALGRVGGTEVTPLLSRLAEDESDVVRVNAIFGLGLTQEPSAGDVLVKILKSSDLKDDEVALAIEALGRIGRDEDADFAAKYLDDDDPEKVVSALYALCRYRSFGDFGKVHKLLASENEIVRESAAYFLARRAQKEDYSFVANYAYDPNSVVATYIINALNRINAEDGPNIVKAYLDAPPKDNIDILIGCIRLFAKQPHLIDTTTFGKILTEDAHSYIVIETLGALEGADKFVAYSYLKDFLNHPEPAVCALAAEMTGEKNPVAVLSYLNEWAEHPSWIVRRASLRASLSAKAPETEPIALKLLDDPDIRVHLEAFSTLSALKQKTEKIDFITDYLTKNKTNPMRFAHAVMELKKFLAEDSAEVAARRRPSITFEQRKEIWKNLKTFYDEFLLNDKESVVRASVLEAAKEFATEDSLDLFRNVLVSDPDILIRKMAANHLISITGENFEVLPPPAEKSKPFSYYKRIAKNEAKKFKAEIRTERGTFKIELYPAEAPMWVNNFVTLAKKKYYDGLLFHRVVPRFVIQAGCPYGLGWGGPGYRVREEWNFLRYGRGAVGVAHSGKDTGGSQIFVTHTPQPHLDGFHTVIGYVTQGMDVVDDILEGDRILKIKILK